MILVGLETKHVEFARGPKDNGTYISLLNNFVHGGGIKEYKENLNLQDAIAM
ncbi:hypothetical protein HNR44_002923 [Geomicrobium halophilum]|uniref:Uncharacterized protein n=1 Tax=Geomicrobium halophilum TaxID=549000 RepID=A0A841Q077_9BACL|nr:hypothetical protein [Geomicrobium halophilum]MBB6450933.1 hypothetical protein [Geomicrobium halophilum]